MGEEGSWEVQKHMGVWQGTLPQGPALTQTCYLPPDTGLLSLGLFSQLESNFSGSRDDHWEMGVRAPLSLTCKL